MLHLTLRQLKVFESVARHLSFSRAAEDLYLTQPAVSMQIKQLEDNVGLPLFEQMGKKIYLTDAGHELYHYSRGISQQLADMELALDELKGLERGKLNISVVSTANYFAPHLLAKFCQRYSGVTVSLNVSNRETVLRHLADNVTDLAIMGSRRMASTSPRSHSWIIPWWSLRHRIIRCAPARRIPVKRLEQETFLVREPGSGTRSAMERFFSAHRINISRGMETDTNEAIKQAVQAGMGLAIMSLHTVELELETKRLKVLDVQDFPIMRHWHVVHRKNKRLSSAAQAFREFLLTEARQLMPAITYEKS